MDDCTHGRCMDLFDDMETIYHQETSYTGGFSWATGVEASILIIAFATIVAMVSAQMDGHGYMRDTSGEIGIEVSIFTLCGGYAVMLMRTFVLCIGLILCFGLSLCINFYKICYGRTY